MLTQTRADELIQVRKQLDDVLSPINFPVAGDSIQLNSKSLDGREFLIFDANRKGARIRLSKCTYQERYAVIEVLLRLDVNGPPHENPDGQEIPCPHLHVYREGYGTKWASPLPSDFTDTSDLVETLRDFLTYCNVDRIPSIQRSVN